MKLELKIVKRKAVLIVFAIGAISSLLQVNQVEASCAYTVPANGSLNCTWTPGLVRYVCPYSLANGGCSNVSPITLSPQVVNETSVGQSCITDPDIKSIQVAYCFTERTWVDSPEGHLSIKNIQVGQQVWSYSFQTQQMELGTVTRLFKHEKKPYLVLSAAHHHFLEVTAEHPVFDLSTSSFRKVSELNASTNLLFEDSGQLTPIPVNDRLDFGLVDDVYNLEVEPQHNYFANGILVHNKISPPDPRPDTAVQSGPITYDSNSSCTTACNSGFSLSGNTCVASAGSCADHYTQVGTNCIPNNLSNETGLDTPDEMTCGDGRIGLAGDGSYLWTLFSSSHKPYSSHNSNLYNGYTYKHTMNDAPSMPIYGAPPGMRCYCLSAGTTLRTYTPTAASAEPSPYSATVSGDPRVSPVTYDIISAQDQNATSKYGPVPIAKDESLDGRIYSIFNSGNSVCSCPNVNEKVRLNGGLTSNDPVGVTCDPAIPAASPARVLTEFNPSFHSAQILSPALEPSKTSGGYVQKVKLPESGSHQQLLVDYNRKIWTCAAPYELVSGSGGVGTCEFVQTHHACDNGAGGGPPSAVSESITGASSSAKFDNVVNKKLACCLNLFRVTSDVPQPYAKFDCIDNSKANQSFDDLWRSVDSDDDGGQLNAIVLRDGNGKVISGFYSLDGKHCDQFSEFAFPSGGTTIYRYQVDPIVKAGQQNTVGNLPVAYPPAQGILRPLGDYVTLNAGVMGSVWNKNYPQTANDYRACPILVRAAMIATCPAEVKIPNALTTVTTLVGTTPVTRCASAASIQIKIKVEQLYEITGQAVMTPIDTLVNANQASNLDISKLITQKYGKLCPPGTVLRGDTCAY